MTDRVWGKSNLRLGVLTAAAAAIVLAVLAGPVGAAGGTFTDDEGSVHEANIEAIAAEGITTGCADGLFCPNDAVTRGQMAAFLHRALEGSVPEGAPVSFSDTGGSVFADDIAWLSATGITTGCADGLFCPHDPVARGQMASFLARALGLDPVDPETVAPPGGEMPAIGPDMLLTGSPGSSELLIQDYSDPIPSEDGPFPGIGTFRVFCFFSHQNFDDPIVFPGEVDRSHLHTFFGNTQTDAGSTAATLAGGGNSTCQGGIADRSGYWIPSMIDVAAVELIAPSLAAMYYQSGFAGIDPASIQPIPEGLMMIAGDAQDTPATAVGGFEGGRWNCFANGVLGETSATIPDCPAGQDVAMTISFPQCWDGANLDSADHKSHMAYPSFFTGCPSSHPVAIPSLMMVILFPVETDTDDWRLVSDGYSLAEPGGASIHADFVNGWRTDIMDRWLESCVRAVLDCERAELGGGEALYLDWFLAP